MNIQHIGEKILVDERRINSMNILQMVSDIQTCYSLGVSRTETTVSTQNTKLKCIPHTREHLALAHFMTDT